MKRAFITVRYDRMKNIEFKVLCEDIMSIMKNYNAEEMYLTNIFRRFGEQNLLLANLSRKQRKMNQSNDIISLRKRLDDMVSALLQNIKSLKRARFEFQEEEIELVYDYTRKHFDNFIHDSIFNKELAISVFLSELDKNKVFYNAFQHLELLKFTDAFLNLQQQIKDLGKSRSADKKKQPPVGITIPSKEKLTEELRFFLKSIELTAKDHPEIEYTNLISYINLHLTNSRKYLRNLATRRVTAKTKAELKKENEEEGNG